MAQLNGEVTGATSECDALKAAGSVGGIQSATVKKSTSFRMKKRGKVPPRFETLKNLDHPIAKQIDVNLRSE